MIARKRGGGKKLGVRHLQLVFAFAHIFLDGIGALATNEYFLSVRIADIDGSQREEKVLSTSDVLWLEIMVHSSMILTTTFAMFVVHYLNNKYFSIALTFVEVVMYSFVKYTYPYTKFPGVVAASFVLSICRSFRFPLALNMVTKWIPPSEHTRAVVVAHIGSPFGRAVSVLLLHIPGIYDVLFFILASLKAIHMVLYFLFGAQNPQTCWILRKIEWKFLCKEIGYRRKISCERCQVIPWKSIFRTPMLYGLMCSGIAITWFTMDVYTFNKYVHGYDNTINISAVISPFVIFGVAWGVDFLISREWISRNNLRKICSGISLWGSSIAVCFMCFYCREPDRVVGYFILASYLRLGFVISELGTLLDLSPNYAVELYAIYCFPCWIFASIKFFFLEPTFPLSGDNPFKDNLYVWYWTAFVLFVFNYGFLMFGDIKWCQFDSFNAVDWRKESQISYP